MPFSNMAAENGPSNSTEHKIPTKNVSSLKAGTFLAGVTLISVVAGFGLALARVKKKNPKEFSETEASRLALKALGLGTALSVSGTGLLVFAVARILNVRSVSKKLCVCFFTLNSYGFVVPKFL